MSATCVSQLNYSVLGPQATSNPQCTTKTMDAALAFPVCHSRHTSMPNTVLFIKCASARPKNTGCPPTLNYLQAGNHNRSARLSKKATFSECRGFFSFSLADDISSWADGRLSTSKTQEGKVSFPAERRVNRLCGQWVWLANNTSSKNKAEALPSVAASFEDGVRRKRRTLVGRFWRQLSTCMYAIRALHYYQNKLRLIAATTIEGARASSVWLQKMIATFFFNANKNVYPT